MLPVAKVQEGRFGGGPKKRTVQQQRDLAAHMRYCKLRKKSQMAGEPLQESRNLPKKRCKLSATEMCTLAFSACQKREVHAERYSVTTKTVRRTLGIASYCVLEIQLHLLAEFRDFVRASPPDVACATVMWDETSQVLALPAVSVPNMSQKQTSSSWQVMVLKVQFAVGYVAGMKLHREVVMPPIPLPSNSATCILQGLQNLPMASPILGFVDEILKTAARTVWLHETDGHLANEKVHYHLLSERQTPEGRNPPRFMDQLLCQNHQAQLVIVAAVDALIKTEATGGRMIPNLYASTLFLRMGGHFVRLLASVRELLKGHFLEWVAFPSEEQLNEGRAFAEELSSFLVDNLRHNARQMQQKAPRGSAYEKAASDLKRCFSICNGPYWKRGKITHLCRNSCCSSREEVEDKVCWCIIHVLLRVVPTLPLLSDWTKLGPNLDFFLAAEHQGLLHHLLECASWATQLPQFRENEEIALISWQKLAGSRYARTKRVLASYDEPRMHVESSI